MREKSRLSVSVTVGTCRPCMAGFRCRIMFLILRSLSALSWRSFRAPTKQLNHSHGPTLLRSWNARVERIYGSLHEHNIGQNCMQPL